MKTIEQYIKSKALAWAPSTLKTERSRLNKHQALLGLDPEVVYKQLAATYKPYSLKTMFIRFNNFLKWSKNDNRFGDFMQTNARLFKNAYQTKKVGVTYDQALRSINSIADAEVRGHALYLLQAGLRISESYKSGDTVTGKGGKSRRVFVKAPRTLVNPTRLRRSLAEIGLTPHALRKLCATRLVEKGATPQDLCAVFGWSNINTAFRYLQPKADDALKELMK